MPDVPPEQPRSPKPKATRIREGSVLFGWIVPAMLIVLGVSLVALVVAVVLVVLGIFPGV